MCSVGHCFYCIWWFLKEPFVCKWLCACVQFSLGPLRSNYEASLSHQLSDLNTIEKL